MRSARTESKGKAQYRVSRSCGRRSARELQSARRNSGRRAHQLDTSRCNQYTKASDVRSIDLNRLDIVIQFFPKYNLQHFMGWYLRKSLGFGPFRLNLSKSGLGYSFGVKGARIGVGPRGHYVRLGRGGLYYQRYFHPEQGEAEPASVPIARPPTIADPGVPIATADVSQLQDSTAETLLNELREKQRKPRLSLVAAIPIVLTIILLLAAQVSLWVTIPCAVLLLVLHAALVRNDYEKKSVALNYDLDPEARVRYVKMLSATRALASSARVWQVSSEHRSLDTKYTAGAGTLMDKKIAFVRLAAPAFVQTKLAVWEMALGTQRLYLFPDRILVYQGSEVGAVLYHDLSIELHPVGFVETEDVPSDAEVIGQTWRYVNKKGGPDRRFSNNRQIPIVRYGELSLRSSSGMNFILQCSNLQKAAEFKEGLETYAAAGKLNAPGPRTGAGAADG